MWQSRGLRAASIDQGKRYAECWCVARHSSAPGPWQALYDIFDDKRHPFYEHKIAA